MTESNENTDKKLHDELDDLREEMKQMKKMLKEKVKDKTGTRSFNQFKFDFDLDDEFDEFNDIGDTIEGYLEGIMAGVADKFRMTMEQFSDGFMGSGNFDMGQAAHKAAKAARRSSKTLKYRPLTDEEEDAFYELAPTLAGALADSRRLKLLRELEKGPKYQGDLSEITDLKGGTFKHHMDTLMELGYVYQEASRGRYLIKQLGIEALKLAEMLFRRYNVEQGATATSDDGFDVPVEDGDAEETEE